MRSTGGSRRVLVWALVFGLAGIFLTATPASAVTQGMRVVVLGDSLGDGIWAGLKRLLSRQGRFDVVRRSRVSTGFARPDYYDWNAELPRILAEGPVNAAVIVMGTNDRQPMRIGKARARVLSKAWRDVYEQRAQDFAQILAARGVPAYWVGLPIMRSAEFSRDVVRLNAIFRAISARYGITYVDTWREFADAQGRYQPYGPDLAGRTRKLRANDGIHFTMQGYERFAEPVARTILTNMGAARKKTTALEPARPADAGQDARILPAREMTASEAPMPAMRPDWIGRFSLRMDTL